MPIKFGPDTRQAILDRFKPQRYFMAVIDGSGVEVTDRNGPVTCFAEAKGEDFIIHIDPLPQTLGPIRGGEGPYRVAFFPVEDPAKWKFCDGFGADPRDGDSVHLG